MQPKWKQDNWRRSMRLKLDYTNMMSSRVGEHTGIGFNDLEYLKKLTQKAHLSLKNKYDSGILGFKDLPFNKDAIEDIKGCAKRLQDKFENFVIIGIGGSALGNIAIKTALNPPYYNELDREKRNNGLKLYFPDNVDPELISGLLDTLDLKKTVFNVITKSGGTSETLANYLIIRDALIKEVGVEKYKDHILVTTDPYKGFLREITNTEGFRSFEVPENVGGRFSILSPVGLLSAAVANIDVEELLAGAADMHDRCLGDDLMKNPAYMNAGLQYLFYRKEKQIVVMMPYVQSLKDIADWFRQLWAESLGKKFSTSGVLVNEGPTPVKALGATDQHSQMQLYIEGPYDKTVIFLTVEKYKTKCEIPYGQYKDKDSVSYLEGSSLETLIQNEQYATEWALTKNGRPNCKIILPEVNPYTIGQLLYMLELQTAFAGELFNINAFDQPGVEDGKKATYALMGRPGYEKLKQELLQNKESGTKYILD